jgi:hypothetical protein
MNGYEIRPHHAFKNWVLVWRNGISLRAFTNRAEAEQFIARHKRLEHLKTLEIRL